MLFGLDLCCAYSVPEARYDASFMTDPTGLSSGILLRRSFGYSGRP